MATTRRPIFQAHRVTIALQSYKNGCLSCWNCWHEENFADMTFEVRRAITADHPSLPGHFPDIRTLGYDYGRLLQEWVELLELLA